MGKQRYADFYNYGVINYFQTNPYVLKIPANNMYYIIVKTQT